MALPHLISSVSPYLMDLKGLMVTKNSYFSHNIYQATFIKVTVCDTTLGIRSKMPMHYGRTDVKVEILM